MSARRQIRAFLLSLGEQREAGQGLRTDSHLPRSGPAATPAPAPYLAADDYAGLRTAHLGNRYFPFSKES
ncbi:hypothetical protein SAM23877_7163 [Streptomyces ambofaciens ATCC 23877]|uniref:Uncharacterized protein n=1 Tax=Streptomyces ambofaciens (strain ATCC 23877 / 3486 / DSM 40053 / JCM 4204 / NBRC 12836 / NRRL B-2516) TaxID=278992 RepID=A0A0K2B4Z7_STRA7|nr:hypothetical protein SAM23877_7163 [Streptomyces ambofaciens ATCC 23877]